MPARAGLVAPQREALVVELPCNRMRGVQDLGRVQAEIGWAFGIVLQRDAGIVLHGKELDLADGACGLLDLLVGRKPGRHPGRSGSLEVAPAQIEFADAVAEGGLPRRAVEGDADRMAFRLPVGVEHDMA